MNTTKTRGAWVVTVKGEEKNVASEQIGNYRNQQAVGKSKGGT